MMMTLFISLCFVGIILAIVVLLGRRRSKHQRVFFNLTSKFHFIILSSFIALLLVMTITVELFYANDEASELPPKAPAHPFLSSISSDIIDGHPPDSSMLVAERTHIAEEKLVIEHVPHGYHWPDILIERKEVNDGMIEERIYKPYFHFNGYDLTNKINVSLPEWRGDTISFAEYSNASFEFVFLVNNGILNQLINEKDSHYFSQNFYSYLSSQVIHLIVPKDLEIIDLNDYAIFVNE